ncbi:DUF4412 domain-containing protein [Costertonia aggregata]|uniref:DUF4412 domain-containing protein n=1 Tax=Costertonia aggregata TaxID=343403 RepID=A0A7H9AR61_9FLAO|nr:DUF4412 domain-containing protein [Costertonia aggregata]QLG45933.1 DUF4412 domain-containing protein [Costertonia aggregata]
MRNITTLLICLIVVSSHGQFLKKLGKKAKQAVERTIERRVESETSKKTDQTIDSVFHKKNPTHNRATKTPEKYHFDSYYKIQLVQKKDTLLITSYFGEDENVLGSSIEIQPGEKALSVIDLNQNKIHSFMDLGDQKTKTSIAFSPNKIEDATDMTAIDVSATGEEKEILGYRCKGYKVQGKEYHGIVWVTDETEIRYPGGFSELQIKNAKHSGVDHKWMTLIDGLALEMDMTVTNKKKPQKVHMLCVELGPTDMKIDTNTYKSAF